MLMKTEKEIILWLSLTRLFLNFGIRNNFKAII